MPLILPGNVASAVSGAYEVANSCRFNDGDSAELTRTLGTPTDNDKWTLSVWVKRGVLAVSMAIADAASDGNNYTEIHFDTADRLNWDERHSNAYVGRRVTNRKFRDPHAWYHIVFVYDSGNATAGNRMRIYVNGTEETSFSTSGDPDQDQDSPFNSAVAHAIGSASPEGAALYFDGYMAEVVLSDGQAYAASDFGEFDEDSPTIWKPKDVSGLTFGDNGFYLDFEASDNLGNDANGGTDWSESNIAAIDQCVDSPTNNFSTWNFLDPYATTLITVAQGNNSAANVDSVSDWSTNNIGMTAGKWYMEMLITAMSEANNISSYTSVIVTANNSPGTNGDASAQPYSFTYYGHNGHHYNEGDQGTYGDTFTVDDYISIALDLDNLKVYFAKNGTWQNSGDPTSGASGTGAAHTVDAPSATHLGAYFFGLSDHGNTGSAANFNFGNGSFGETAAGATNADDNGYGIFKYDVPAGYYALCTKNLAEFGG